MGSLVKKARSRITSGAGITGASGGGFQGSTQYTGRTLGQKPKTSPSTRPTRTGSKRTGGARTPLSV